MTSTLDQQISFGVLGIQQMWTEARSTCDAPMHRDSWEEAASWIPQGSMDKNGVFFFSLRLEHEVEMVVVIFALEIASDC